MFMELLAELDGQAPGFSESEFFVLLRKYFGTFQTAGREKRFLHVRLDGSYDKKFLFVKNLLPLTEQIALSHTITPLFFSSSREDFLRCVMDDEEFAFEENFTVWRKTLQLPAKRETEHFTFGVDCSFICSKDERKELYPHRDLVKAIKQRLGSLIIEQNLGKASVELSHPDTVLTVYLGEKVYGGISFPCVQRRLFEKRAVENRPFFSPISVEPKWTRASLNLLNLPAGSLVYDPFCGTGGILIEAGLLGHRAVGSDIDTRMVEGSARNLRHFKIEDHELFQADVGECKKELARRGIVVDAVVSDFPYGKASTLAKEARDTLYGRAFSAIASLLERGAPALLILPSKNSMVQGEMHGLHLDTCFPVYIHATLTRYFCLYKRC